MLSSEGSTPFQRDLLEWSPKNRRCKLKVLVLRAASPTSQGPWPCNCEGPCLSSKGRTSCLTDMVCWNLCHAYPLEVDLTQIPTNHETLSIVCHVGIYVDFSSTTISLLVWSDLGRSWPFWPMRNLGMQWARAFSLVCEVALSVGMPTRVGLPHSLKPRLKVISFQCLWRILNTWHHNQWLRWILKARMGADSKIS